MNQVKSFSLVVCAAAAVLMLLMSAPLFAQTACTRTADSTVKFSVAEAMADFWQTSAGCINVKDPNERSQCRRDAQDVLIDVMADIELQDAERRQICRQVGEAKYAPVIEPNQFVDFDAVLNGQEALFPNPHFPLEPGTVWEYIAFDAVGQEIETSRVEVLSQTREILGVQCIVVRDQVWEIENGDEILVEDTQDFFAQDLEGTVWYFGETSQEFEDEQLVSLDGSWVAGQDGAQPGIIMQADPNTNGVYRQEFLPGEAEDVARVIGRDEVTVDVPAGTFSDDVVQTREWSPLEPETIEFKFYAPDVGLVLETNPDTGEELVLVEMTGA